MGAENVGAGEKPTESKCPVDHTKLSTEQLSRWAHPWKSAAKSAAPAAPAAAPAEEARAHTGGDTVYDVYGQELNKANLMPSEPNQLPSPGQQSRLSTARAASTIPKGGDSRPGETWTYPSAQMFWNALTRKGKADDVAEADIDAVVAVHNTMNEKTWAEVVAWESRFHCDTCADPKLLRFQGRPDDLSPAARWRMWTGGYPRPFDRHDWVVDRCGVESARYIIDYYYRETSDGGDPIEFHVRPAIDSPSALWDRIRANAPFWQPPVSRQREKDLETVEMEQIAQGEFDKLRNLTPQAVKSVSDRVTKTCEKAQLQVAQACAPGGDETKCKEARVGVTYCVAREVCRPLADGFRAVLDEGKNEQAAYEKMEGCVQRFAFMAHRVMAQAFGGPRNGPEFAQPPKAKVDAA